MPQQAPSAGSSEDSCGTDAQEPRLSLSSNGAYRGDKCHDRPRSYYGYR